MILNNNNLQIAMIMNVQSHTRIVIWQFIQNIHKYELFSKTAISFNDISDTSFFSFHYPRFPNFHNSNNFLGKTISLSPLLSYHFPYLQQMCFFSKHIFKILGFLHTFQNLKMAFWFAPKTFISIHACL